MTAPNPMRRCDRQQSRSRLCEPSRRRGLERGIARSGSRHGELAPATRQAAEGRTFSAFCCGSTERVQVSAQDLRGRLDRMWVASGQQVHRQTVDEGVQAARLDLGIDLGDPGLDHCEA